MRGAIPSRSCGARSEVITSRRPAVMISFIVWKNSSCVESLPAMNWTSSISSRSALRSRLLKPIVSFSFSARMNSTMNFSADIDTTRRRGRRARKSWPMACSKWVLPRPVPPWMNNGLKLTVSAVASVWAAVAATSLALPTTNVSKR